MKRTNYLPLDINAAISEGSICYVTGTLSKPRDTLSSVETATVAWQDIRGRVHAGLVPAVACRVRALAHMEPGTVVRITAEPCVNADGQVYFAGSLQGALEPVYADDPACLVGALYA